MKVSILTPDFSSNALGRAYLLAQLISKFCEVEIVGPAMDNYIWNPLLDQTTIPFKVIKWNSLFSIKEIFSAIDGDIIYVSKPLITSFGVGLLYQKKYKIPLILDIDDWELGFALDNFKSIKGLFYLVPHKFNRYHSLISCFILEKVTEAIKDEIQITVSNSFLQKKFGGTIIWHTRDEDIFDPKKYNSSDIRRELKIQEDKIVVMFIGTPRPYKGVIELILSIYNSKDLRNDPRIVIVIGGIGDDHYSKQVVQLGKKLLGDKVLFMKNIPFKELPKVLSICDIYVIPQKRTYSTFGQMPAKLFDAMAMGKAIISTDVSDIPRILDKVGIIVSSDETLLKRELSNAILYLIDNSNEIKKLGKKARTKFIKQYGFKAMRRRLKIILQKVIKNN